MVHNFKKKKTSLLSVLPSLQTMPQLRALSARKAAATSPMSGGLSHRASARVAGTAKPRALAARAVMGPNDDDRTTTMATSSSSPFSSPNAAPRVRVFEKLASTVAINVRLCIKKRRGRDRRAEALAWKRRCRLGESKVDSFFFARRGGRRLPPKPNDEES